MEKTIKIVFSPGGKIKVEAFGFTGNSCEAATKVFTDALGGETTSRELKDEYYLKDGQKVCIDQLCG